MSEDPKRYVNISVGMPAWLLLNQWAEHVGRCFDETCYLVGSACFGKAWRDVDIRIIMEDEAWVRWFGRIEPCFHLNHRWSAMMTAFAVWGKEATGLPIDFQVYPRSHVKESEWEQPRCPVGLGNVRPQPWEPKEEKENAA